MDNNLVIALDYKESEFASLALLEGGDIDVWLRRRGVVLVEKSRETAKDCEAGKLASAIALGASALMSSNPLAWIPLSIGAAGYLYTIFQEFQDIGSVRPLPMYRGKIGDILKFMEGDESEQRHPLEDQIEYLSEAEKDEVLLLNYRFGEVAALISAAPPKVRFDLYRHICGQFHARRDLVSLGEVNHYVTSAVGEQRKSIPFPLPAPEQHAIRTNTKLNAVEALEVEPTIGQNTRLNAVDVSSETTISDSPATPSLQETIPKLDPTLEQAGQEILDGIVKTRRSTLLIGDTGAGKSVAQAYILTKLFEVHSNADVWVLSQKADSFCGLAEKGRMVLFNSTEPEQSLILIDNIWKIYDRRRRLHESQRPMLSPVRLILADWLSIKQSLEELRSDESVKASRYLSKLADIIYNGRELNVCLLVDLQSYNLAAVGLKADRNSRKNFNLIGLGNYSIDELGMVNESYGVLVNLIGDRYIVADESERTTLNATFKRLQPLSKDNCRPIIFSGLSPARLALLPDLRQYKSSKVAATTPEPAERSTDIPERSEIPLSAPEPDEVERLNGLLNKTFSNSEPTDTNNPEPLNLDPFNSEITPTERGSVVSFRRSGRSKEEVIFMVWGAKKGGNKAYLSAKEKLDRILSESGL